MMVIACDQRGGMRKLLSADPDVQAGIGNATLGDTKAEGMTPPAVVVFDTRAKAVSGFDGCNDFKGSYSFDQGLLKAKVSSTRRACTSDMARTISARLGDLFTKGAEVVDTSFMGAHVLMLRNAGGDVRMGSTEVLRKP